MEPLDIRSGAMDAPIVVDFDLLSLPLERRFLRVWQILTADGFDDCRSDATRERWCQMADTLYAQLEPAARARVDAIRFDEPQHDLPDLRSVPYDALPLAAAHVWVPRIHTSASSSSSTTTNTTTVQALQAVVPSRHCPESAMLAVSEWPLFCRYMHQFSKEAGGKRTDWNRVHERFKQHVTAEHEAVGEDKTRYSRWWPYCRKHCMKPQS